MSIKNNKKFDKLFIKKYLGLYKESLFNTDVEDQLIKLKKIILNVKKDKNKVIIVGNGGSAAISSHVSVDLTKVVGVKAINFNEADLLTCLSNDYGYERWVEKALEFYSNKGDLVILISSSGSSKNIVLGAKKAKQLGLQLVTFTGFNFNNKLKKYGDLNFWLDSKAYNIIENTHLIWLLTVCDLIIGKAEYKSS
tara:strand:+ start:31 stop:615 length:585 start_codon:yes stop_codon:yes gene_type:complete